MNKKLIAMMIVPLMLLMSGALAYSAFSGQANTSITAKAGTITVSEYAEVVTGYSQNTNLTITGGYGSNTQTATLNSVGVNYSIENLATVPNEGGLQNITYFVNITNLAPGNWVELSFTLRNNGSVGVMFGNPVVNAMGVTFTGSADLNLSNVTGSAGNHGVFVGNGPTSDEPLANVSLQSTPLNYLFATNYAAATGTSAHAQSGYAFAFGPFSSGFGGVL